MKMKNTEKNSIIKNLTDNSQTLKISMGKSSIKYFSSKTLKSKIFPNVSFKKNVWKKNFFVITFYVKRFIEKIKLEILKRKFEKLDRYHYNLIFDLSEIPEKRQDDWGDIKREENERILKIYKKNILLKGKNYLKINDKKFKKELISKIFFFNHAILMKKINF